MRVGRGRHGWSGISAHSAARRLLAAGSGDMPARLGESHHRHVSIDRFMASGLNHIRFMEDADRPVRSNGTVEFLPSLQMHAAPRIALQLVVGSPVLQQHRAARAHVHLMADEAHVRIAVQLPHHRPHRADYRQPLVHGQQLVDPHSNDEHNECAVHFRGEPSRYRFSHSFHSPFYLSVNKLSGVKKAAPSAAFLIPGTNFAVHFLHAQRASGAAAKLSNPSSPPKAAAASVLSARTRRWPARDR
ncbi:hypothetical protein BN871_DE_00020 [Paenibacillus sp. P22]|nr:hypothetical protein BN871_DE_00020 [Paenibacillus sp. P22]